MCSALHLAAAFLAAEVRETSKRPELASEDVWPSGDAGAVGEGIECANCELCDRAEGSAHGVDDDADDDANEEVDDEATELRGGARAPVSDRRQRVLIRLHSEEGPVRCALCGTVTTRYAHALACGSACAFRRTMSVASANEAQTRRSDL